VRYSHFTNTTTAAAGLTWTIRQAKQEGIHIYVRTYMYRFHVSSRGLPTSFSGGDVGYVVVVVVVVVVVGGGDILGLVRKPYPFDGELLHQQRPIKGGWETDR